MTTVNYATRAETWLLITTLTYFLMNGAQIFETLVIVPKWTACVPDSFQLLQGKYGLDLKTFWIVIHSLHEITFIAAIAFCWDLTIRNYLLMLFLVHFIIRLWTLFYFAPVIISFQKPDNKANQGTALFRKVQLWKNLNYIRVSAFIVVSINLVALYVSLLHLDLRLF